MSRTYHIGKLQVPTTYITITTIVSVYGYFALWLIVASAELTISLSEFVLVAYVHSWIVSNVVGAGVVAGILVSYLFLEAGNIGLTLRLLGVYFIGEAVTLAAFHFFNLYYDAIPRGIPPPYSDATLTKFSIWYLSVCLLILVSGVLLIFKRREGGLIALAAFVFGVPLFFGYVPPPDNPDFLERLDMTTEDFQYNFIAAVTSWRNWVQFFPTWPTFIVYGLCFYLTLGPQQLMRRLAESDESA